MKQCGDTPDLNRGQPGLAEVRFASIQVWLVFLSIWNQQNITWKITSNHIKSCPESILVPPVMIHHDPQKMGSSSMRSWNPPVGSLLEFTKIGHDDVMSPPKNMRPIRPSCQIWYDLILTCTLKNHSNQVYNPKSKSMMYKYLIVFICVYTVSPNCYYPYTLWKIHDVPIIQPCLVNYPLLMVVSRSARSQP